MRFRLFFSSVLVISVCFGTRLAYAILPATPQPVKVELVSESSAISPGFRFRSGVLFTIEPGWHIYWKNPGDSGLPTRLQLSSTDGLAIGSMMWPQHEEFELPGAIQGLGYSDKVLIFSEFSASDAVTPGSEGQIKAKVSWLACSPKLCIPGSKDLELKLVVKDVPDYSGKALFDTWQSRVVS